MAISVEPKEGEEEEESITDGRTEYEQFIDEELQESLPALIAREIPEEPRAVRREISRNAATLYKKIDRERPVRPPSEREAVTAMPEERPVREEVSARRALEYSTITERIVSHKPAVAEDVCEETCPLVKEQKGKQLAYFQKKTQHYHGGDPRIVLIFPSRYLYIHPVYMYINLHSTNRDSFLLQNALCAN